MSSQFPPPPVFGVVGNDEKLARNGIISLVDIFDDFLFSTNERTHHDGSLHNDLANSTFSKEEDDEDEDESNDGSDEGSNKPRKRARGVMKSMTEEQKIERRFLRCCYLCFQWIMLISFSVGKETGNMLSDRESERNSC